MASQPSDRTARPAGEAAGFPSIEEIDRIAAMTDAVRRNLLITQSYFELSAAVAQRIGAGANWSTYATWASKQAGTSIRREDLARVLEESLASAPRLGHALGEVVTEALRLGSRLNAKRDRPLGIETFFVPAAADRTSAAMARGNLKVFAEIGREISRFLSAGVEGTAEAEALARFLADLQPGDPPAGQRYLRQAFTHLCEARAAADPKARAERMFLANLEMGYHEQVRLQPEIEAAMESALPDRDEFRSRLLYRLFPAAGMLLRLRLRLPAPLRLTNRLDHAIERLYEKLREALRQAITEVLMRLELPTGEALRMGRDLARSFPASLATVADPELRELLARLDLTPDSLAGSGAADWADFAERMHYITDYFRCYLEEPALLGPPFTAEQASVLAAGGMPAGRL